MEVVVAVVEEVVVEIEVEVSVQVQVEEIHLAMEGELKRECKGRVALTLGHEFILPDQASSLPSLGK